MKASYTVDSNNIIHVFVDGIEVAEIEDLHEDAPALLVKDFLIDSGFIDA